VDVAADDAVQAAALRIVEASVDEACDVAFRRAAPALRNSDNDQ
jgi:hypothetical protein